jgi:hypothetical protein
MAEKTRHPYRTEAIAGVDLDAETENEELRLALLLKVSGSSCQNVVWLRSRASRILSLPPDGILIAASLDGSTAPAHVATG